MIIPILIGIILCMAYWIYNQHEMINDLKRYRKNDERSLSDAFKLINKLLNDKPVEEDNK